MERATICIADVTGKGMPAALLMSNLQAAVRAFGASESEPAALCARVNRAMTAHIASGRFVTLFYGILEADRRTLTYTNAGHNPPLLLRADGRLEELSTGGLLMGIDSDVTYEQAQLELRAGDRLVLYTDGVTEAMRPTGELYGEDRLLTGIRRHGTADPETLQQRLLEDVPAFCGGEFQDDATVLVVAVE